MHQLQPQNPPMRIPVLFSWLFLMPICLLSISFCISAVSGQCLANQQSLLLQLKNSLVFDTALATKLVHWNQSVVDCCLWEGVTCDIKGRVIGLDLTNESISGELGNSRSLFSLRYLQHLNLAYNNFSNEIPSQFDKLTNLSYLNLSNACFTGQNIPVAISHLTRFYRKFPEKIFQIPTLQTIDLSSNIYLQGSLPEFPLNGSLRMLLLQFTRFSGTLPRSIGNLKMLTVIDLSYCNFNGSIPKSMASLTQLLYLDMSANNFFGSIPSFSMGKNLTTIDLSNNDLTGPITSTRWEELPNLEFLDLRYNSLEGSIPISLFFLPSLLELKLSNNRFSGRLNELPTVSSSLLKTLDLSHNNLEGPIPMSVFEFRSLESLSLSGNIFNGSLQLNVIPTMRNLSNLDLSNNSLVMEYNGTSYSFSAFPQIITLSLASNKLKKFPHFLINLSTLEDLDLSHNQIHGEIPNWIWKLPSLHSLNISDNNFETLNFSLLNMSSVSFLDLSSNQLQGKLSVFPKQAKYLDFSKNNFSSVIPVSIGDSLDDAYFLSLSSNKLYGSIPRAICNITYLRVLDLSNNSLSGTVPQCLIEMSKGQRMFNRGLGVLNLRRNNLIGAISNKFPSNCDLQYLNLNGNQLEGKLPKSLARCTSLKVLDIGNNHIEDGFPCYLKNISDLHVLVLRSNKFYGPIDCLVPNASWPMLQIVDLAANNFTGKLQIKHFSDWKAIMNDKNEAESQLNHFLFQVGRSRFDKIVFVDTNAKDIYDRHLTAKCICDQDVTGKNEANSKLQRFPFHAEYSTYGKKVFVESKYIYNQDVTDIYYQDVMITVTMKGKEEELVKILTIFTSLDFSCNNFDGPIPEEIGELKLLLLLNLSHNAFTGQIPQSFGKLSNLESLDLSTNDLTGEIPVQLADGLIFLSVLNLSFNQLVGKIPQIKQFSTFLETSYEGNIGLCGFPLKEKCNYEESGSLTPTSEETHSNFGNAIDWNFLSVELGFVFGIGIVIGPLMFWKRWRICYYKHADDIFFKMFPQLYIRIENRQRRTHRNQGQRARGNQGRRH